MYSVNVVVLNNLTHTVNYQLMIIRRGRAKIEASVGFNDPVFSLFIIQKNFCRILFAELVEIRVERHSERINPGVNTHSPLVSLLDHDFKRVIIYRISLITCQIRRPGEYIRRIHCVAKRPDLHKSSVYTKLSAVIKHLSDFFSERGFVTAVRILHGKLTIGYPYGGNLLAAGLFALLRFVKNCAR